MKPFHAILLVLATLAVTACSSIDCNIEGRVLCHYDILDINDSSATLTYPLSVTFNRTAADSDTVYINKQSNVSAIDLPMSYGADTDVITLTVHLTDSTSVADEIRVTKTNQPQFESVDCAPRYHHTITAISSTHNFIDSVIINNPNVSNDASVTNIHIRVLSSNE